MNITVKNENTLAFNGWVISNCGNFQTSTKVNSLLGFLYQLKPNVEAIIADARLGTRSPHGYASFFKTATSMRKVIAKYQTLVDVAPVIVSTERTKVIGTHTAQPRFECVEQCVLSAGIPSEHPVIVHTGTERISICPSFFEVLQYPAAHTNCPSLGSDGKFKPGDGQLLSGGFAFMVHALVLLYSRELYGSLEEKNDFLMRDMQNAVELNARQSLLNPESYGFYAGGK
ncbi:MAG: hypothetical protein Q9222_001917 [Ikaeria aurantiellina]